MNPTLLINFTDGIRDASPSNRPLTVTSVSISPGQFGDGGDFTSGTVITPPLNLSTDFTLELWVEAGSTGILWDMSPAKCPVPCGVAQPANKLRFVQLNKGKAEAIV
jgi:hypothetical protein